MKRFLVFVGDTYYPSGGWGDYRDSADTLDEAIQLANTHFDLPAGENCDWAHIVDTTTMEEVAWREHIEWLFRKSNPSSPQTAS